jgi:hypothetical protein
MLCISHQISIIRVINSRILRLRGHVTRMGESRSAYRVLVEKEAAHTINIYSNSIF